MKFTVLIWLLLVYNLNAKEKESKKFIIGLDITINAQGNKSFGSGTDNLDKAFDYRIDKGIQYKIGYKFNHSLRIEYGYSRFYSKEYKNFNNIIVF